MEQVILKVVEVEQADFVLLHHFQFVEQQHIQLQLELEEQEPLQQEVVQVDLEQMEQIQYFQQLPQQEGEEVDLLIHLMVL